MRWIPGARVATRATINRPRPATSLAKWSAIRTWIAMEPGATLRTMETCGCRTGPREDGRPITMAIGFGGTRGAGPGWMTLPGDSRHSTMAGGLMSAVIGVGCRGRWLNARCTRLPWWLGWAAVRWEAEWAGLRSARARSTCLLITPARSI